MVLGKLPVPGRPTIWITVGQGPTALTVGAGGGGLDIFTLIYPFSPLAPSLWETARYRLKYCLKGPLNQKTTNQLRHIYSSGFTQPEQHYSGGSCLLLPSIRGLLVCHYLHLQGSATCLWDVSGLGDKACHSTRYGAHFLARSDTTT